MKISPTISLTLCLALALTHGMAQNSPRFDQWDKNKDGKLTKDELPRPFQRNFERVDTNKDGFISREEDAAVGRNRTPQGPGGQRDMEGLEITADIDYAGTDNPKQKLDLILPKERGEDPLPVVCWIHGGGWRSGDKGGGKNKLAPLVRTGKYAGVSIGYRLSGEAIWPAQIHDVKAAIRWVRAHAETHNLDPDRIAVWGSSAGGHLVTMLGVTGGVEELEGEIGPHLDQSSTVACVVDFYGPKELLTMDDHESSITHNSPTSPESLLIGGAIQRNPEKARAASPISYVSKEDAPILSVHGDEDMLVPYPQSVDFEKALEAAGGSVILITVQGGGHGKGFGPEVNAIVSQFLENQFYEGENDLQDQTIQAIRKPN